MNAVELLRMVDSDPQGRRVAPTGVRWVRAHKTETNGQIIVPVEYPQFLFRGQAHRYSPCYASICRDLNVTGPAVSDLAKRDQLRLIQVLSQGVWFCRALKQHPAMQWAADQTI